MAETFGNVSISDYTMDHVSAAIAIQKQGTQDQESPVLLGSIRQLEHLVSTVPRSLRFIKIRVRKARGTQ